MLKTFPLNAVKPAGWLKRQLEIQAAGLSGNLDKIWPDVRDSKWIGGDREGWERAPYWLDGVIPLAYLLDDEDLKKRAKKYIDGILDRQQEDGWICPCAPEERAQYDIWSAFLIGKVLSVYCGFSGDERAHRALRDSMLCLYRLLKKGEIKLHTWGQYRWFEALIPLIDLYDREKEEWIRDFAEILREQGADYASFEESWKRPLNLWTLHTHIVNIAMMLKYEAVYCELTGKKAENTEEHLWEVLEKYNGTAVGTFTGDECLSGIGATHGTELCSVVELMYSCELLYAITGKSVWAQRLEALAFNALPATLSDDMWTHQYDQLVNQIACLRIKERYYYRTNSNESNVFGLEPNYGCCTANFSQGWPKFAMNAYLRSPKGVVCPVILPAVLNTNIKGADVRIQCETEYPFRFEATYRVSVSKKVKFQLKIRIPAWAKKLSVNGEALSKREYFTVEKSFEGEERFVIRFEDAPVLLSRPKGMKAAKYGSLIFALPLASRSVMHEYEDKGVERKFPYCDYELFTDDSWQYGFASRNLKVLAEKGDEIPFSSVNPSVALEADLSPIDWEFADGYENVAAAYPKSAKAKGEAQKHRLIPYGCAKLRMTEMPLAKKG